MFTIVQAVHGSKNIPIVPKRNNYWQVTVTITVVTIYKLPDSSNLCYFCKTFKCELYAVFYCDITSEVVQNTPEMLQGRSWLIRRVVVNCALYQLLWNIRNKLSQMLNRPLLTPLCCPIKVFLANRPVNKFSPRMSPWTNLWEVWCYELSKHI